MNSTKHISVQRLGTRTFNYELLDENGDPIVITGGSIELTAKEKRKDSSIVIEKAGTIVDGSLGLASITLEPTDTDVSAGEYFYDVVATVGTDRYTVEHGTLTVIRNISS